MRAVLACLCVVSLCSCATVVKTDGATASALESLPDKETARVEEAEQALREFNPDEAIAILDKALDDYDKVQEKEEGKETSATDGFNHLAMKMTLMVQQDETRFFALLATEQEKQSQLKSLYGDKPELQEEWLNRYCGDGTTADADACYQLFAISGQDAMAERSFQRMLKLNEADPLRVFRLRVLKASTLMGLADPEGAREYERAAGMVDSLDVDKLNELAAYRSFVLLPALALARRHDYSGAVEEVQKQLKKALPKKIEERLQTYEKTFADLADAWPAEQAVYADEPKDLPRVEMITDQGRMVITLFEDDAPNTVASFITLVEKGFYDGLVFHRVVPHFVVQGGDPDGTGEGGPGYSIKLEATRHHFRGALGMARSEDPDSAGSQFYFCLAGATTHHLDEGYAVFGRVSEGLDVMDKLRLGGKIESAKVLNKRDHEYKVEKLPG